MKIDSEDGGTNPIDEKEKKKNQYRVQFKVMLFQNIQLVNNFNLKNLNSM
jgi:hypothetical protein